MKLKFALCGAVFAVLLVALLLVNHRRRQDPVYILSQYAPNGLLDVVIASHSQPVSGSGQKLNRKATLIYSSWFDQQAQSISQNWVGQNGKTEYWQSTGADTIGTSPRPLSARRLAWIQTLLPTLPPGAATPPALSNLLIVSFWRDGQWTTRLYDRSNLPPQVVQIYQILGISRMDKAPNR